MKNKFLPRAASLLLLLALLFPVNNAGALAAPALPPVDMFQLPWDQGLAWVAIDGFDNGSKRPVSSSHNHKLGGAIDFAPKSTMITGENTSFVGAVDCATCTYVVVPSQKVIDGEELGLKAGSVICLDNASKYGNIEFINVKGTESAPITIGTCSK